MLFSLLFSRFDRLFRSLPPLLMYLGVTLASAAPFFVSDEESAALSSISAGLFIGALALLLRSRTNLLDRDTGLIMVAISIACAWTAAPVLVTHRLIPGVVSGNTFEVGTLISVWIVCASFFAGYIFSRSGTRMVWHLRIALVVGGAIAASLMTAGVFNISFSSVISEEIRPSASATMHVISREFAGDQKTLFVGSGPNSFFEVWNRHRPQVVSVGPLWDTDMVRAYSLILLLALEFGVPFAAAFILLLIFTIARSIYTCKQEKDRSAVQILSLGVILILFTAVSVFFYIPTISFLIVPALAAGAFVGVGGRKHAFSDHKDAFWKKLAVGALLLVCALFFIHAGVMRYRALHLYQSAHKEPSQMNAVLARDLLRESLAVEALPATIRAIAALNEREVTSIITSYERDAVPTEQIGYLDTLTKESVNLTGQTILEDRTDYRNWLAYARALFIRGRLFKENDTLRKALETFTLARAWAPAHPRVLFEGAEAFYAVGRNAEAEAWLQDALQLRPDYKEAIELLRLVQGH